ncbi:bifunctional diguanylate cyclase/phosphodiesterase [Acetobacterium bakii]|uniref:bifunctional diguanylate cyclase/phosphodiesterase n=1 Tax=Acetobacterium bakii TaxID=52689 RepID=UPI0006803D1F|nr:EAL domain-containing protein [Acetobacterium bakii]
MIKWIKNRTHKILFNFIRIFLPSLIIILILSYTLIQININTEKEIIKIRQLENSKIVSANINSIFNRIYSDINVIINSNEIKSYYTSPDNEENLTAIARMLSNIAMNNGVYDQLRVINNSGFETVRVNYDSGGSQTVSENNLQYKGDRYYFTAGMTLNQGDIYISPMDLNIENTALETPAKPVIRLVAPMYNEKNEKVGILVLNYLAQNLLNQIANDSKNNFDMHTLLLNNQGFYLLSDQTSKNFSFMYDTGSELSFKVDKPIFWQTIEANTSGYYEDHDNLYYYTTQHPADLYENLQWHLIYYYPLTNLGLLNNDTTRAIIVGTILIVIALIIISYIIAFLLFLKTEDLTVIKDREEAIKKIKNYDENTGLANQSLFEKTMGDLIKQYDHIAIITLQITNFNNLYNNLGMKNGLDILKETAHRIKMFLAAEDLLAKFHKDEFAIARVKADNKLDVDHFTNKLIASLNEAIIINNEKIYLNVSIGISMFQEHSVDVNNLIEYANIAKNYSVQTGNNAYVYYAKEIKERYLKNLKLETHLRSALEKNELSLNYQPQVITETGEIIGMEALLRWHNPELGNVGPGAFIPVAEKTDLIIPIGNWVLEEAIKQNKKWQDTTHKNLVVGVNISPIQFKKTNMAEIILQLLMKYSLPGEFLEIEITENVLVENLDTIRTELKKIKNLGVKISIDDFGTGYSSLSYLRKLEFDKLKIDREFIKDYPEKDNGIIAKIIVNLSEILGLKVIAEGVETKEQFLFLKDIKCGEIQGYYFHKPMTASEFEKLISN